MPLGGGGARPRRTGAPCSRSAGTVFLAGSAHKTAAVLHPYNVKADRTIDADTARDHLGAAAGAAIARPAFAADPSARAFVARSTTPMWARTVDGVPLDNDQTIQRYFEPSLAAPMMKDQNARPSGGRKSARSISIRSSTRRTGTSPPSCRGERHRPRQGERNRQVQQFRQTRQTVVLDLVKIKNAWKISDITWTPHEKPNTLRALYAHS